MLFATAACHARESTIAEPSNQTLRVNGLERDYLLYTPHNAGSSSDLRPLVFVLHGGGGTARQIASHVGDHFMALADREGFYLVFPDAIGKWWDFGMGKVAESRPRWADDHAFFESLIDTLATQLPIDRRRIFATGISRGGQASYFMACALPGRIRAIA
ncbi:MAG: alpha/beta hydrolase family esterase, partial [Gammaproteobacteria bacterium]